MKEDRCNGLVVAVGRAKRLCRKPRTVVSVQVGKVEVGKRPVVFAAGKLGTMPLVGVSRVKDALQRQPGR